MWYVAIIDVVVECCCVHDFCMSGVSEFLLLCIAAVVIHETTHILMS